ncbi:MAG TPA: IclR family transcriptional regulator [Trueperaceae bacterium]
MKIDAESEKRDPYHLQTLARGAAVLNLLARQDFLTLKEASRELELDSSVTYRLLRTWTSTGFLDYDPATKRYHAGLNLLRLATRAHSTSGLPEIEVRLRRVSQQVDQTASCSVLAGRFVLYVARVVAHKALMYQVEIGKTLPAYATSAGHVLLAFEPLARVHELFPEPTLLGFTEHTVRSRDELLRRLAEAREQGYAINRGQLGESIAAVAVPVRDQDGRVVGAFSIAGPEGQFSNDAIYRRYLPALLEAAKEPVTVLAP